MSLAELFGVKETFRQHIHRRRLAKFHEKIYSTFGAHRSSRFVLEPLEPRVLLSATPTELVAPQDVIAAAVTGPVTALANLDVDLNGTADALTDGILIIRHLFGFTGAALTNGVVDPAGQRTDPTAISTYLDQFRTTALDVDQNGSSDALTDGILIIRNLFGFTGSTLTDGAVDPAGARTSPAEISTFLNNINPALELIAPVVTPRLVSDTGLSATDRITFNPTIAGSISDLNTIASFRAGLDATLPAAFTSILGDLSANGTFSLTTTRLNQLAGGTLTDGTHTLHLQATDSRGNVSLSDFTFTLDRLVPTIAGFGMSAASDTGTVGDNITSLDKVVLTGSTDAGAILTFGGTTVFASGTGAFQIPDVSLATGPNVFSLTSTDLAGNTSQASLTITRAGVATADVALSWNQLTLDAIRFSVTDPPIATRILAMVSLAQFDTLAAIENSPAYLIHQSVAGPVSVDAALAKAAHTVLYDLFPAQRAAFDTALNTLLAGIADGTAKTNALTLGLAIGQGILAVRANDGSGIFVDYPGSEQLGQWRPDAPMFDTADEPQWGGVTPFALTSGDQFRPDAPPALDSAAYAASVEEVRLLGSATSATRTADQTQQAQFWADGKGSYTPPGHWDLIAAQLAQQQGNSLSANVRLFAQLNVAMADAGIAAWDAKYTYDLWRPIDAIQQADLDNNAGTIVDGSWTPLLITPSHPEYVSGHSTFSMAAATILAAAFGNNTSFSTTAFTLSGVTRTFTSFTQAAQEAGRSRIYGGIHYEFTNQVGQQLGQEVGNAVLARFALNADLQPPVITTNNIPAATSTNVTFTGQIFDNISGVAQAQFKIDNGALQNLTLDSQGRFTITTVFALDGTADGAHTLSLFAGDIAGNVSPVVTRTFTLDTRPPVVNITSLAEGAVLNAASRLTGSSNPNGSALIQLNFRFDGGIIQSIGFDTSTGVFDQPLPVGNLDIGDHALTLTARDAAGNLTTLNLRVKVEALAAFMVSGVTPVNGSLDVGVTFRPQISFSRAVNPTTLTQNSLYLTAPDGSTLAATIVPAQDGSFAWLFVDTPMPGGAQITLHVDGSMIRAAADGAFLDADGNGVAGGELTMAFTTVSTTPVAGTVLTGKVVDPGPDLLPMTFDDIRRGPDGIIHTPDDVFLNPIVHAKVYVLGLESHYVYTDANGNFTLDNIPAGEVKVAVDGRTASNAPAGIFWPEMVMAATLTPGVINTMMASMGSIVERQANAGRVEIYLPRVQTSVLQSVSDTQTTVITVDDPQSAPNLTESQRQALTLTVNPGSAIGVNGQVLSNVQVGISTVPPELVLDMLPPGVLQHTFDITIQAPGVATFAEPVQVTFPNVFNAAPGTQLSILSFDHTTGMLVINGTGTVSADGLTVVSDPGSGVRAPGWHGVTPPGGCGGSGGPPPAPVPSDNHEFTIIHDSTALPMIYGDAAGDFFSSFSLKWTAPQQNSNASPLPPILGCEVPPHNPSNNQQPYINVTIEIDGPLKDFVRQTGDLGLEGASFTLSPGSESKTFSITPKSYAEMFGAAGIASLSRDQLYGSKIKITTIQQNANGTRDRTENNYYLYRWVDVVDAPLANDLSGDTAAFLRTNTDFVVRHKNVDMHLGNTPTQFVGTGTPFDLSGTYSGNTTAVWSFDPPSAGTYSANFGVVVQDPNFGLKAVGSIVAKGTATEPTIISINVPGYQDELRRVLTSGLVYVTDEGADGQPGIAGKDDNNINGIDDPTELGTTGSDDALFLYYDYGGGTTTQFVVNGGIPGFVSVLDSPSKVALVSLEFIAEFNDFLPGKNYTPAQLDVKLTAEGQALQAAVAADYSAIQVITVLSVNDFAQVTMTWEDLGPGLYGSAQFDFAENSVAPLIASTNSVLSEAAKEYALSEALNQNTVNSGKFAVGINTKWESSISFAEFVANTVSHEIAHTFGLNDAYLKGGGNMPPNDIMGDGSVHDGNLSFAGPNVGLLLAAMGMASDGDTPLIAELSLVQANFNLPQSITGIRDELTIVAPALGARAGNQDLLPGGSLNVGTVAADGAGGALRSIPLTLTNLGQLPLNLGTISLANGNAGFRVLGNVAGTVLNPNDSTTLTLVFDPTSIGAAQDVLTIASNSLIAPAYVLRLSGSAFSSAPQARVDLGNNNFGGFLPGAAKVDRPNVFTIHNDGAQPLVISAISLVEGSGPYTLLGVPASIGTSPISLARGESFSFGASFAADRLGLQRGIINVVTNDPVQPNLRLSVTGTGVTALPTVAWGQDYFAINDPLTPGMQPLRAVSDAGGHFSFFLPSGQAYHLVGFDPATGLVSHGYGTTAPSGRGTDLTATLVFLASTAADRDFDGLPDDIEQAIGTGEGTRDSDRDGLDDFTEIRQGLDPLGGLGIPTGIVSAVSLQGTAEAVALLGSIDGNSRLTALVATGSGGLATVDASQFKTPRVLAELDLPGTNTDVAVDPVRGLAVVAANEGGLHIVDVSDPVRPTLVQTLPFAASHVEVRDGFAYATVGTKLVMVDLNTGDVRQTLGVAVLGGFALTDISVAGNTLYTMDVNHTLRAISVVGNVMTARGSLLLPDGGGKLFVGDGVAYVGTTDINSQGYLTADVANPDSLTLLSGVDANGVAGQTLAANGSGLLISTGMLNVFRIDGGFVIRELVNALDVSNSADPANTSALITRIRLPAAPKDLKLANGLAFVADGAGGLQIVNYVGFDTRGVAPFVSIAVEGLDADPATPGIQVLEGRTVRIVPTISDDVQVRNVELLVNGQVVSNDVAFPFDLFARAPTIAVGGNTLTVQVRATDTGGNVTSSSVIALDVVTNTFPPQLLSVSIDNGASLFFLRSIDLDFDKPLDVARLTNAGVSLLRDGGDGTFGTADDVAIGVRLDTRDFSQSLSVVIEGQLVAGNYQFILDPAIVADYAGHQLGAPVVRNFTIRPASGIRAASGVPEVATAPSANPGQTIVMAVPFNPTTARADFSVINSTTGVVTTKVVTVQAADAARGLAYFAVPFDAITGDVVVYSLVSGVRTDFPGGTFPLQIVPIITDVRVASITSSSITILLDGFGFIEANGSEYRFGSEVMVDNGVSTGPDVGGRTDPVLGSVLNGSVSLTVPLNDGTFGPVNVRTAGGTSASYVVNLAAIQATAFSGTPADPAEAFANPGQAIRLSGTGLSTSTNVLFRSPDNVVGFVKPIAASADGASATLIVPATFFIPNVGNFLALGDFTLQTFGSASQSLLQILPAVSPAAAPLVLTATLTQVIASVTQGTPAAAAQPAANVGDVIELVGTNFGPGTRVLIPIRDTAGNVGVLSQAPLIVNAAGTRLQVRVPGLATTGDIRVVNQGSGQFGFGSGFDAVHRNVTMDFTAGTSTAAIHFADGGLQGLADESWGIDNVVVRQGETVVFADDFEGGASANWNDPRTDNFFALPSIGRFSGRFSNDAGQVLNLTGLTPGANYRVTFDLLALDSWEGGNTTTGFGPDLFIVRVDGVTQLFEILSNVAAVNSAQSFRASDGLRLQVVPTLTAISGRPGETGVYTLSGSGFMEGASTLTIGGVALVDTLDHDLFDVSGSDNPITGSNISIAARTPRILEGPVRITTAGGFAEMTPSFDPQAIRSVSGIVASASLGVAANPTAPSANTGQTILLQGGGFTGSNQVQFQGVDDSGALGTLTRTVGFTASNGGLLVEVPALARTGPVTVLGSGMSVNLQVVPVLRAVGGSVAAGNTIVLEGTGLTPNDLVISIDGRAVGNFSVRTVLDGTGVAGDQQFVTLTVPNGVSAGVITVSTAGGQSLLRTGVNVTDLGATPGTDASTLADAVDAGLTGDSRIVLTGVIGTGTATSTDVDMYRVPLATGSRLRIGVTSADLSSRIRIFNATGTQLATTTYALNATNVLDFTAAQAGVYFVGISGSTNSAYNPTIAGSGIAADAGSYQLRLETQLAGSSRLIAITGTAVSGTPGQPGVASANTGQSITVSGVGLTAADRVVFTTLDDTGAFGSVTVTPTVFNLAAQTLTVTVPANATTGQVRLALDVANAGLVLQIVPTITDTSIADAGFPFAAGTVTIALTGSGFAENATSALLGGPRVDDLDLLALGSANNLVEISATNTRMSFRMASIPAGTGLIRISTVGGTSAALDIGFTGIIGSAASGTPASGTLASANSGDTITLIGSHFDSTTDVIFQVVDTVGNFVPMLAKPTSVNAAGTQAQLFVPISAVSGEVRVVGSATTVPLQIIPVITAVQVESVDSVANTAQVLISGVGFVEGHDSEYLFGSTVVRDWTTTGAGADVISRNDVVLGTVFNGAVRLTVPLSDGFFGPVRAKTTGGVSAEFVRMLSSITATATSGTPANGSQASANPGQAILLNGTNFSTTTGVLFRVADQDGNVAWRLVNPTSVTGTTQLTVVVPQDAITGVVQIVGNQLNQGIVLQVVPVVTSVDVTGVGSVHVTGLGLVEGHGTVYRIGSGILIDTAQGVGPDVSANGTISDLTLPVQGIGTFTVTTAGGTSAPIAWNVVSPGLGTLIDVAYDPATNTLWAADNANISRIDKTSGAVLESFVIPVTGFASEIGLQFVAGSFSLNGTPVAAGSLLMTNGSDVTDQFVSLNSTSGAVIASLSPDTPYDFVAGVYHAGRNMLFGLDGFLDQLIEIQPETGATMNTFSLAFDVQSGGLSIDAAGNIWIATSADSIIHRFNITIDTVDLTIDLAKDSISAELTGLATETPGFVVGSSNRGVVYFQLDPPVGDVPAPTVAIESPAATIEIHPAASTGNLELAYVQQSWVKNFVDGSAATVADKDQDEELVIAMPV